MTEYSDAMKAEDDECGSYRNIRFFRSTNAKVFINAGAAIGTDGMITTGGTNNDGKIFIMNNRGYGMIKQTQETWLDSRYVASSEDSLYFPDPKEIARAHGIENVVMATSLDSLQEKIADTLNYDGPVLCDVAIHPNSRIYPKLTFGKPIEDSSPFLDRSEFLRNMIVKPI